MICIQVNNIVSQMKNLNSISPQLKNYFDWSLSQLPDTLEDTYLHDQVVPQINQTITLTNSSSLMQVPKMTQEEEEEEQPKDHVPKLTPIILENSLTFTLLANKEERIWVHVLAPLQKITKNL